MRAMRYSLAVVGSSLLCVSGAFSADRIVPQPQGAPAPVETMSKEEKDIKALLDRLSEVSKIIEKDPQGANVWRYQLTQADVSLHLALRSKGKERDDWLRMAVDNLFGAAVQCPENEPLPVQRLTLLPGQLLKAFPDSSVWSYAAMSGVRADHMRAQVKAGDDPSKAQLYLRDRLLKFAQEYPSATEAPKAVEEAAQISEAIGKKDDAGRCYRYLTEKYAGTAIARKAEGSLWRLRTGSERVELKLPRLYPSGEANENPFTMSEVRGKLIVVCFWSCHSDKADRDIQTLKILNDQYYARGLEILYVNLDKDAMDARSHLAARLTGGTHLHAPGGLEGKIAERYGISAVPEVWLLDKDGTVIKHSLQTTQLEAEIAPRLANKR